MGRFLSRKGKQPLHTAGGYFRLSHFWHASYGYTGTLNDKTILDLSPFQECRLDGSFEEKLMSFGVVPFSIAGEQFNKIFVVIAGIYMNFLRFVNGIKTPLMRNEM